MTQIEPRHDPRVPRPTEAQTTRTTTIDGRSVGDLLKELRDETGDLLREEVALVRTEMSEKVGRTLRNTAYLAAGGMIALLGVVFLLLALTSGLAIAFEAGGMDEATALWLAPLVVGLVVALIGYALVQKAISTLRNERMYPEKTAQTMKENYRWAKEKVR